MLSLWGSKRAINAELDLSRCNQVQLPRFLADFVPLGRILLMDQHCACPAPQEQDPRKEIRSAQSAPKARTLLMANVISARAYLTA